MSEENKEMKAELDNLINLAIGSFPVGGNEYDKIEYDKMRSFMMAAYHLGCDHQNTNIYERLPDIINDAVSATHRAIMGD